MEMNQIGFPSYSVILISLARGFSAIGSGVKEETVAGNQITYFNLPLNNSFRVCLVIS